MRSWAGYKPVVAKGPIRAGGWGSWQVEHVRVTSALWAWEPTAASFLSSSRDSDFYVKFLILKDIVLDQTKDVCKDPL